MPKPTPVEGLGPETPLREAAPRLVGARLRDVGRHLRPAQHGRSPDAVHDLRVCCRRLRVALELFGGARGEELSARVKVLQDALGAVRDLHVQSAWLHATGLSRLIAERESHLEARASQLDHALRELRTRTAPAIEKARRSFGSDRKLGGKKMRKELERRLRTLEERLREAKAVDAASAHRLRIAAKKLRYELELLEPAFPEAAGSALEELEPLQDALGELHDADARLVLLNAFLEGASNEEVERALAALAQLLAERDELAKAAAAEIKRWRKERIAEETRKKL